MSSGELLYHYTTPEGLVGIVRDGALWASDLFYLNDHSELKRGIDKARDRFAALLQENADTAEQERLTWLIHDMRRLGSVDSMHVFACSFSLDPDSLSQWRAYCRGGGFAIGFPLEQLKETASAQAFELRECVYEDAEHDRVINRIVLDCLDRVSEVKSSRDWDDRARFKVSGELHWAIMQSAPFCKDQSFAVEREYRAVSRPSATYDKDSMFFRTSRGLVVPYRMRAITRSCV